MSRMMYGSPVLMGDNTIPGVKVHKEVREQMDLIFRECRGLGLDFYPTIVEFLTYDEISEIASYGGFPVRYPHWRFGMEYEELARGYEYGMHRISEMVVNTNPCLIYCLDSNPLVDHIDVIAHALGHNHFFKNNIFFKDTDTNMMNKMANHGQRIRKYMARWGKEKVTEFIDQCLRLETLIDPARARRKKTIVKPVIQDERNYFHVNRRKHEHNYMDDWINSEDYLDKEKERVAKQEAVENLDIFDKPDKDILGYLKDHAPMKPWQQDIISMLYEESMYFAPQRATKMINEGFASWVDFKIMVERGLCAAGQKSPDCGIVEYAHHKMLVLGGKFSMNPYKVGYEILRDIEERWNKGRFGKEWDECTDLRERQKWNKKLGLGQEKVFEVVKCHNDATLIAEYFTPELCDKMDWYDAKWFPNGEKKIVKDKSDYLDIKKKLIQKYTNGGLPDIRLTDPNHLGKGWFLMQHYHDGRPLYDSFVKETITALYRIWKNNVVLATKDTAGTEFVYVCDGPSPEKDVHAVLRSEYEKEYVK